MEQATQRRIRVAIVDDIQETRDNLTKLLLFEKDIQVVGNTGAARDAIDMARKVRPDIILMDINMPDMDGITATERICSEVLGVSIIMMSVLGDQDSMRRSMLAGAREFLTKPFGSEDLVNAIRHVYQLDAGKRQLASSPQPEVSISTEDPNRAPGRLISCFSPKGGVGCTTVVTNLAVAIKAATGKEVVLVDSSLLFGDVGVMLNLVSSKAISDLVSRVDQLDDDLIDGALVSHPSGVKALLAPPRPQMAELITPDHMRMILQRLQQKFDYVLVDTWPSFHDIILSVLDLSDQIILVMTLEMPSIKDVRLFLEVAELLNYSAEKLMLVVNRADSRLGIRIEDVESSIKHKIAATIANDGRSATLAMNQGVPLVLSDKNNPISKNIFALADLILGRKSEPGSAKEGEVEEKRIGPRLRSALHLPGRFERQPSS